MSFAETIMARVTGFAHQTVDAPIGAYACDFQGLDRPWSRQTDGVSVHLEPAEGDVFVMLNPWQHLPRLRAISDAVVGRELVTAFYRTFRGSQVGVMIRFARFQDAVAFRLRWGDDVGERPEVV